MPLPTKAHNYIKKVYEFMVTHPDLKVADINVIHDSWCDIYSEKGGYCNCDPRIEPWAAEKH